MKRKELLAILILCYSYQLCTHQNILHIQPDFVFYFCYWHTNSTKLKMILFKFRGPHCHIAITELLPDYHSQSIFPSSSLVYYPIVIVINPLSSHSHRSTTWSLLLIAFIELLHDHHHLSIIMLQFLNQYLITIIGL